MRDALRKFWPSAWRPAKEPDNYPTDLDGSLRYVRLATGIDYFPWIGGDGTVAQIGAVNGFMRQLDVRVWSQMTGKVPSGPFSTTSPLNLQWQVTVPGLSKSY